MEEDLQLIDESLSISSIISHMDLLSSRIDKIEKHILEDIQDIENKLQKICELNKGLALLQFQLNKHQEILNNIDHEFDLHANGLETSINCNNEKYLKNISSINNKMEKCNEDILTTFNNIDDRVTIIENNNQKWVNRVRGGWFVLVLVIGVLQYIGMQYIDKLLNEKKDIHTSITVINNRLSEIEMRQQTLEKYHATK